MSTPDLAERIRGKKGPLAVGVVDEMYANPFWMERFANRGRKFAEEDLGYHVDYLVQALVARDPGVLERYARWLQSVLTTRGMCSVHLADSFTRLGRAVAESIPDSAAASGCIEAAVAALRYPDGPARELQDASGRLAEIAVRLFAASRPDDVARWGARGRELCLEDAGYHLAYLADALALDRPAVFVGYVTWIDGFLRRRNVGGEHLRTMLSIVAGTIEEDATLSVALRRSAGDLLRQGADALGTGG
ncbi:MAG TPA: hypothetical protein VM925_13285 [Labilithrix sp.]|nr:hypothetical protein [Labilithrix sp.]